MPCWGQEEDEGGRKRLALIDQGHLGVTKEGRQELDMVVKEGFASFGTLPHTTLCFRCHRAFVLDPMLRKTSHSENSVLSSVSAGESGGAPSNWTYSRLW